MRILVVTDVSLYMRGGVPAEVRSLLGGLVARGHAVALASHMALDEFAEVVHFGLTLPIGTAVVDDIARALKQFEPDFVHVLSMNSRGVAQLAPLLSSRRWALTIHSLPPYERKLAGLHHNEALHYSVRALRFLANGLAWRWVLHRDMAPLVIVHSRYVADIAVRYGCNREQVHTIALPFVSGASTQAVRPVSDSPLLVTVGGYAHTKGQHDVVKALALLSAHFPRLRCQLIGEVRDDSYLRYVRGLAHDLGVSDRLSITPDLTHADKLAALQAADVYVQPSHEEGFCLAYAEAAAVVPRLVGTDTGAIAAISEDDSGARVVAVRDPSAIAAAVRDLLDTVLPTDHMARRAAHLSARFSELAYLQSHETLYEANR